MLLQYQLHLLSVGCIPLAFTFHNDSVWKDEVRGVLSGFFGLEVVQGDAFILIRHTCFVELLSEDDFKARPEAFSTSSSVSVTVHVLWFDGDSVGLNLRLNSPFGVMPKLGTTALGGLTVLLRMSRRLGTTRSLRRICRSLRLQIGLLLRLAG